MVAATDPGSRSGRGSHLGQTMRAGADLLIGIDSGTSVIKAVAFELGGRQIASPRFRTPTPWGRTARPSSRSIGHGMIGAAAIRGLGEKIENLAARTAAIAVTAQGDGTWLVGAGDRPVSEAWLWLDARAAPTVERARGGSAQSRPLRGDRDGPQHLPAGLAARPYGPHRASPARCGRSGAALQGLALSEAHRVRATDPSEASFTFGNFRSRAYDDTAIEALGLSARRGLLPEIIDGTEITHPLTAEARGRPACSPVRRLARLCRHGDDGARRRRPHRRAGGLLGDRLDRRSPQACRFEDVFLNAEGTGYVIALPVPGS